MRTLTPRQPQLLKGELANFRRQNALDMVDYFTLALTHGLLALVAWRLWWRDDLDREGEEKVAVKKPFGAGQSAATEESDA